MPTATTTDRLRGTLMPPSGVPREVFLKELLEVTREFMRLLDCHAEGVAPGPLVVLVGDHEAARGGNEVVHAEVGNAAVNGGDVVLEHEIIVRMIFKGGHPKKTTLISDGKPLWHRIAPAPGTQPPASPTRADEVCRRLAAFPGMPHERLKTPEEIAQQREERSQEAPQDGDKPSA